MFLTPFDNKISKKILFLSKPVIFSNLSRSMMGIVDMIMIGGLGSTYVAAAGMGAHLFWFAIAGGGFSMMSAVHTITARRLGQREYKECSTSLYNGLIIGITYSIIATSICLYYVREIVELVLDDPVVIEQCISYAFYGFISVGFIICTFILRGFFTGIEKTYMQFRVTVSANLLNVYLNAALIFGSDNLYTYFSSFDNILLQNLHYIWAWYTFPELKIEGAGIGTLIASIYMFLYYCYYLFDQDIHKKFDSLKPKLNLKILFNQIKLAFPITIDELSGMMGFVIFFKLIGRLGTDDLAISIIIFRILHVAFMPGVGIGQACQTLISKYLGEKNVDASITTLKDGIRHAVIIMGSIAFCFLVFPGFFVSLFTSEIYILETGKIILMFCSWLLLLDAIGIVMYFTLVGAGDTKILAKFQIIKTWVILVPFTYLFLFHFEWGVLGAWLALGCELAVIIILCGIRIKQGKWKKIQV